MMFILGYFANIKDITLPKQLKAFQDQLEQGINQKGLSILQTKCSRCLKTFSTAEFRCESRWGLDFSLMLFHSSRYYLSHLHMNQVQHHESF